MDYEGITLQIIEIGGKRYLGETDGISIKNAFLVTGSFEDAAKSWICKKNLDQLLTVNMGGSPQYTETPFSSKEKRIMKRLQEDMLEVKSSAIPELENAMFQSGGSVFTT